MINVLLISICVMVLITMISSIIGLVVITKYTKSEKIVGKVLKIAGLSLLVLMVIITAVGISYIKDDNKVENNTVTLETAGFNEVNLSEYLELIKEDDKNIILVARPTCGFCEQFTPVLKQAMDDMNLTINYIDTDKFSSEDWATFSSSLAYLNSEEWGTPLVLIVQNSDVIAENNGYVDLGTIKSFFKANGYGE